MLDILMRFATALLIGALVGVDRERKQDETGTHEIGGIRTFALFSLAGATSAWIAASVGEPWIFAAGVLAAVTLVAVGYVRHVAIEPESIGLTTEIAAVLVFLLGGAAMTGSIAIAVALGIATSAILAFKQPIHAGVASLSGEDMAAGLKLLIATFIVLPVLPDKTIDPWGAINPHETWMLVVLISGLSLVGYVASRWLGEGRGLAITAVAGAIASSTAVTLAFARRSREDAATSGREGMLAGGVLLAWGVMFVKVCIEVAIVHPPLLRLVIVPMSAMGLATLALAAFFFLRHRARAQSGASEAVPLKNPFSLLSAIHFALLFALVLLVVKLVQQHFPGQGVAVVAALAGLTDVDAITLSMAQLARDGGDAGAAVVAITIAAFSNTLTKAVVVGVLGTRAMALRVLAALACLLVVGGVALLVG